MKSHLVSLLSCGFLSLGLILIPAPECSAESQQPITTFSRIDDAYANGDLDYETALVNKIYAIYQPQRVKTRFRAEDLVPAKCATPLFMEIRNNWSRLDLKTRSILEPYLLRPTEFGESQPYGHAYEDTAEIHYYDTPSGHFRIWYVTTTDDAPALKDISPVDGVPDYINQCSDVFDHVWYKEVDEFTYQAPPQDGNWYPDGQDYGGNSKYDVYIEELGRSIFGYTQAEYYVPGSSRSAASYLVVDNDYEWYPEYNHGKQPIDGLKVTAAHEFFHAIHFGYDAAESTDRYWMEITAVWMEDAVYDPVNDYLAYLYWYFSDPGVPLDEFNSRHEYGSCIWAMFLDQQYGFDIIHDIWERCVSTSAFSAMDGALTARGSGLDTAFQLFTVWNYFTDSRANPDQYYEEGAFYPMVAYEEEHIAYPASGTERLNHLSANYISFKPSENTGGLFTSFDGGVGVNWGTMIVEYQSPTNHFFAEIELDAQHQGSHATRNWINYSEIVLIPSIVSITGRNFTYTYDGEYDPALGASLVPSEATHHFGSITIGDTTEWSLFIYNDGLENRIIDSVGVSPVVFEIPEYTFPLTLIPSESLEILITFHPDEIGAYTGQLTFTSDDTLAPSISISLSGNGTGHSVSYALLQNFPSPFKTWENPYKTYIPFTLTDGVNVTIQILSITGQLVRTLDLGHVEAGSYQEKDRLENIKAYWDGTNEKGKDVSSGIYFYVINAGDGEFVETKKMALLR